MKVLLINGSPKEKGCTYTALNEVATELNKQGIETEILHLGKEPIADCKDCSSCRKLKKCIIDDKVNEVIERADEIDGFVFGSPVYYASASAQLLAFMDRLFFSRGKAFRTKPAAAVVSCRRGGASAAFDTINKYFMMNSMPVVTSQYWNQVHGFTPEDVLQDKEGLQTMRTLAKNMAWLLKCIESGRQNGVAEPEYERITLTNFIK